MNKKIDYDIGTSEDNVVPERCPVLYALDIVGQKWKLPILWHLFDQDYTRYNELKRSVPGITNIMLTKSLRELEDSGLVHRRQYDTVPPRVEYSLTDRGKALIPTLNELYHWGKEQMELSQQKK